MVTVGNIGDLEKDNLTEDLHFPRFLTSFLESVRNERNGENKENLTIGKEFRALKTVRTRRFFKFFPVFSAVSPEWNVRFREGMTSSSILKGE